MYQGGARQKQNCEADGLSFYRKWFWIWLFTRTILWIGAVIWSHPNGPLDLMEWTAWGHSMSPGYPKHPPLAAWIAGVAAHLSPGDVWGVYIASYIVGAVCLWAAWRIALEFLPPGPALFAALSLDGLIYLTGDLAEFSNNVVLDAAWALTALFFVRAVKSGRRGWWFALGVAAGLGVLSKYSIGILLFAMGVYLLCNREGRRHLAGTGPYLALLVFLAMLAPHALWVVRHHFITVHYAVQRSAGGGWFGHIKNPVIFLVTQLLKLAPLVVVLLPLLAWGKPRQPVADRALLDCVVLWPIFCILALSAITGSQLRDTWGSPLLTFAGVWVLAVYGACSQQGLLHSRYAWAVIAWGMAVFSVGSTIAMPYLFHRPTRATYPGRQLAAEVTARWHHYSQEPLPIVAGEGWRADNACCYSRDFPVVYTSGLMGFFSFEPEFSPWTSDADMAARGGVLLWNASQDGDDLPAAARMRFAHAVVEPPIVLHYQTGAGIVPDRVGVAFVLPGGTPAGR